MAKIDEITKEQALKLLDTLNEDRNNLKNEKQQLILFLENEIKEKIKQQVNSKKTILDWKYNDGCIDTLKIVLDFVNKGDKDE